MIDAEKWRDVVRIIEDESQLEEFPSRARQAFDSRAYSRYKGALTAYTNAQTKANEKRLVTCTREYVSLLNLLTAHQLTPAQEEAEERLKAICPGYMGGRV